VAAWLVLALVGVDARGDFINPGYDLFETDPNTTIANAPAALGGAQVHFQGVPFIPGTDVDTIVERTGPSLPSGGTGLINIRLDALFLKSTTTMTYTGIGPADLYATRNFLGIPGIPEPIALGTPRLGSLDVLLHNDGGPGLGGGTFNLSSGGAAGLPVDVDLIFTKPGGNPNVAADRLFVTTDSFTFNRTVDLSGNPTVAPWSHTPRFDDAHALAGLVLPQLANAGNFYPGVSPGPAFIPGGINGIQVSPAGSKFGYADEESAQRRHGVFPGQTSEPGALILFGTGLAITLGYARVRRAAG